MADEVKTEEEEQKPFEWTNDAGDKFSEIFDAFSDQLKEDLNNLTAVQNMLSEIDKKHFGDPTRVSYVVNDALLKRLIAPAMKEFETDENKIESVVVQ